jgi:tetratricopeptide (TPR) repeat protein
MKRTLLTHLLVALIAVVGTSAWFLFIKRDAGRAAHEPVPKASELKPTQGFSCPPLHAANEAALGHLLSGLNRLSAGDRVGAESDFLQATVLDAGNSDAYTALANSQEMQAKWAPAEENYRKALALNPSQCGALTGLGNISYHNHQWGQSIAFFKRALDEVPDNGVALWGIGIAYRDVDLRPESKSYFLKYLDTNPEPKHAAYARDQIRLLDKLGAKGQATAMPAATAASPPSAHHDP